MIFENQKAVCDQGHTPEPAGLPPRRSCCEALKNKGFRVTQATVSRDIKELGLIKGPGRIRVSLCFSRRADIQRITGSGAYEF